MRLGEGRARSIDVRIIATSSRDLAAEVAAGRFRSDLWFRLNGTLSLQRPPLRDRIDELPLLATRLAEEAAARRGVTLLAIPAQALFLLARHTWPGNIRELRHVIERAAALDDPGPRAVGAAEPRTESTEPAERESLGRRAPGARTKAHRRGARRERRRPGARRGAAPDAASDLPAAGQAIRPPGTRGVEGKRMMRAGTRNELQASVGAGARHGPSIAAGASHANHPRCHPAPCPGLCQ